VNSLFFLSFLIFSSEFAKERERVDTRRKFFKVRRQQQLDRQVHAYQSWIDKAGKINDLVGSLSTGPFLATDGNRKWFRKQKWRHKSKTSGDRRQDWGFALSVEAAKTRDDK